MGSTRKASLFPYKIRGAEDAWYYETNRGIEVVAEFRIDGEYKGCAITKIPWATILKSAKRCGKLPVPDTKPEKSR